MIRKDVVDALRVLIEQEESRSVELEKLGDSELLIKRSECINRSKCKLSNFETAEDCGDKVAWLWGAIDTIIETIEH